MQGIYINHNRPKSKKQIRDTAQTDPSRVSIEATSMFGNEYDGPLSDAPDGNYTFVGPCPHTSRKFYGSIVKQGDKIVVK